MSDQTVNDEVLHLARMSVRALGNDFVGNQWAERETELYAYMLAGTLRLAEYLHRHNVDANVIMTVRSEVLALLLECAEAARIGQQKLWSDFLPHDEPHLEGGQT